MTQRTCPLQSGAICRREKCEWWGVTQGYCVIWYIKTGIEALEEAIREKNERERA